jgi:hypothetical protein
MYENAAEVESAMGVFLERSLGPGEGIEPSLLASVGRFCRKWTPQPMWDLAWRYRALPCGDLQLGGTVHSLSVISSLAVLCSLLR